MWWKYLIEDLNEEEIIGTFYKKELQKTNQKRIQDRKNNYKEWKGNHNSFNSWIDKKDVVI